MEPYSDPRGARPAESLMQLRNRPERADLMRLATATAENPDKPLGLRWKGDEPGEWLILSAVSYGKRLRKNWADAAAQVEGVPEWELVVERADKRKQLWTVKTGDVTLVLNLVHSKGSDVQERNVNAPVHGAESPQSEMVLQQSFGASAPTSEPPPIQFGAPPKPSLQQNLRMSMGVDSGFAPLQPQAQSLTLAGNIRDVDLMSVIQSIHVCKMSGKLNVNDAERTAELFFIDGELVHARSAKAVGLDVIVCGDSAVLELFMWDSGTFQFQHGWKTSDRSVQKKLYVLMLEGAALMDYRKFLRDRNIGPATFLAIQPACQSMSVSQFEETLKKGIPAHLDLQKRIFQFLRKPKKLSDMVEQLALSELEWVPAVFNLINLEVLAARAPMASPHDENPFASIYELIGAARKAFVQPDTGMVNYSLFLLLVSNEFARSLVRPNTFCIAVASFQSGEEPINDVDLQHIGSVFAKVCRPFDVIAWDMSQRCFMMFPQASFDESAALISRVLREINIPVDHVTGTRMPISARVGVAEVPTDGNDLMQIFNVANRYCSAANPRSPIVSAASTIHIEA